MLGNIVSHRGYSGWSLSETPEGQKQFPASRGTQASAEPKTPFILVLSSYLTCRGPHNIMRVADLLKPDI